MSLHDVTVEVPPVSCVGYTTTKKSFRASSRMTLKASDVLDLRGTSSSSWPSDVKDASSLREIYYAADSKNDAPTYDLLRSIASYSKQIEILDIQVTGHGLTLESDMNLDLLPSVLSTNHKLKTLRIANCPNDACRPHVNTLFEAVAGANLLDLELHLQDTYTGIQFQTIAARNLLINIGASCPKLERLALKSSKDDVALFARSALLELVPKTVTKLELSFFQTALLPWNDFRKLCSSNKQNRLKQLRIGICFPPHQTSLVGANTCSASQSFHAEALGKRHNSLGSCDNPSSPAALGQEKQLDDNDACFSSCPCALHRREFLFQLENFRNHHPHVHVTYHVKA